MEENLTCKDDPNAFEHAGQWWREYDARGIYLCRVCDHCVKERLSKYRPDVLRNPNYWADEPIESE